MAHLQSDSSSTISERTEIKKCWFWGNGNNGIPRKNTSEQERKPTTNSCKVWCHFRDSNPGHIGGRRVLSPLIHPWFPQQFGRISVIPLTNSTCQPKLAPFSIPLRKWLAHLPKDRLIDVVFQGFASLRLLPLWVTNFANARVLCEVSQCVKGDKASLSVPCFFLLPRKACYWVMSLLNCESKLKLVENLLCSRLQALLKCVFF